VGSGSFAMNKPIKPRIDPLKIYMNAEAYRMAYIILGTQGNKDPQLMSTIASPQMVLSAFAIELYFKCLLCIETGSAPQTHNRKALFRELGPKTKARIEHLWSVHAVNLEELWAMMEKTTGKPIPRDFSSLLDLSGRAFSEIRYVHEDPTGSFLVGDLPPVLRIVILERQPLWATLRHAPPTSLPRGMPTPPANSSNPPQGGSR
jgi:hypothetical protein